MTYLGKSGRQYVVIAAGMGSGNKLFAFALPDSPHLGND
jgi:glucose dehydrogenase